MIIDEERIINGNIIKQRISNVFVGCKKGIQTTNKFKQSHFFDTSIMNGSCVTEQFQRNTIAFEMDTDWTIIRDAFINPNEPNSEHSNHGDVEIEELRCASSLRRSLRLSIRRSNVNITQPEMNLGENDNEFLFTPPSSHRFTYNDVDDQIADFNIVSPPTIYQNNTNNENNPIILKPLQTHLADDFSQINGNDMQINEMEQTYDEFASLDKNSLEFKVLVKLMVLWEENCYPISIEKILPKNSSRFLAARTFGSLLGKYHILWPMLYSAHAHKCFVHVFFLF